MQTDVAALGDVTLTVWDQEVRGGQNEQMERLNAAFQEQYPNVTIDRVSRSFDDLATTLRLALSGNDAPDVVQANNGRADMGAFVSRGPAAAARRYAEVYGWDQRFPEAVRQYVSYTPDGKVFGEGELYGLPQVGEVVGVYYNPAKLQRLGIAVPGTWEEFEAALATAKAAGTSCRSSSATSRVAGVPRVRHGAEPDRRAGADHRARRSDARARPGSLRRTRRPRRL